MSLVSLTADTIAESTTRTSLICFICESPPISLIPHRNRNIFFFYFSRCGDIFCSAHCSKEVPLDQALDFNPSDGIMSRACVGCYEAYEQWQGVIPSPEYDQTYLHSAFRESHEPSHPSALTTAATESSSSSSHSGSNSKKNTGQLPDGYLGNDGMFLFHIRAPAF